MGGEFFATVIGNMNLFGRVALCGAISEYNMPDNKLLGILTCKLTFSVRLIHEYYG